MSRNPVMWLLCGLWLLGAGLLVHRSISYRPAATAPDGPVAVRDQEAEAELSIVPSALEWHGVPVYRLLNTTNHSLTHLTLTGWAGELLPVLWMGPPGTRAPDLAPSRPQVRPPFDLPAGWAAWFADGARPPIRVTALWTEGGRQLYAYLRAPFGN
ncbi:MAG: hypothetical protein K6T30_03645 [Alicyclobacillus sp.]|nr:hypothetical protein [Alicyclobacillus sp.]